jgi:hypothetical protein
MHKKCWFESLNERPRHRWEGNTTTDFKRIGWGCSDCIHVAKDRMGSCENSNKLLVSIKLGDFLTN